MTNGTRIPVALLMLASGLLAGCEAASPSTPSLPPPAGMIELTTNRPDGATLVVNPCADEEGNLFPCTRDLQMTFSVVLNRDVDSASVGTKFYTATGQFCAVTNTPVSLTAATPVTLTVSPVYMLLRGITTECGLPLQTTRIVTHLYRTNGSGDLLTQEFPNAYTFTEP